MPKIMAFKTKKNNPKLTRITGKVKIVRIGSKTAFNIPKTAAEIAAFPKLSMSIPRKGILEIIKKLIVVTNQMTIIRIALLNYQVTPAKSRKMIVLIIDKVIEPSKALQKP